jgi:hypothetical protein
MSGSACAALSHRICTGIPRRRLGKLIEELAQPWVAQQASRLGSRWKEPAVPGPPMICRLLTW